MPEITDAEIQAIADQVVVRTTAVITQILKMRREAYADAVLRENPLLLKEEIIKPRLDDEDLIAACGTAAMVGFTFAVTTLVQPGKAYLVSDDKVTRIENIGEADR